MKNTPQNTSQGASFIIQERLVALEDALNEKLPGMATILKDIHTQLKNDPDVVTVLTEEQCAILVKGLKEQTKTQIATAALKAPRKKALSKTTLEDL